MAKQGGLALRKTVSKRTCQGGMKPKLGTMNKSARRNYKAYRGQGR